MNFKNLRLFSIGLLILIAVLIFLHSELTYDPPPRGEIGEETGLDFEPDMTPEAREHILYGDGMSGGHLHGVDTPCKSEFPATWDAEEVIERVNDLADNDNVDWRQEDNGYYVSEQEVGELVVRIVLNETATEVVTAYPTNVERNPCPDYPAANDN